MRRLTCFSVIVPVYDGAETIEACLTALVNQEYPQDQYEIIVVNDGSTDETAKIASRYPVRLINLETNQGRIIARNTGTRVAKYEALVFNDVRAIPEPKLLAKVSQRNYQPLIPNVDDYDGSKWGFARFFFLLRCKVYAPYYPLEKEQDEFWITPENFDRMPKGTTNLVCDRKLWFTCQPEIIDKSTNDDIRILHKIVEHRPILRTSVISVKYKQRTELRKVISHTFERGPRFADYYLRPGGRYHGHYPIVWLLLSLMILGIVLNPLVGAFFGGLLLLGLGIVALYLSQDWTDIIVVGMCLPIIMGTFGLGILKWRIAQLVKQLSPERG